jgi:3-oxoadipate enol-lactonase
MLAIASKLLAKGEGSALGETTAADGTRLAYDVWGKRDGEPVLLIQGLGSDSRGWALQRMALGRRYRCIAVDNRGVGRSGRPPGPYPLATMADDACRVLDAEGVERAHVIGASMGGAIAQIIAIRHPERVRSLVLACTSCQHHPWRCELFEEWIEGVERSGIGALRNDALKWLIGPRFRARFGPWVNLLARIVLHGDAAGFIAQARGIIESNDDLRFELTGVTVPTLVVTGSQDMLTPIGDAEEIAELIPGAQLIELRGAGHGIMVEAPNAFNAVVREFLDEVSEASKPTELAG